MSDERTFRLGAVYDPASGEISGPIGMRVEDGVISALGRNIGGADAVDFSDAVAMPGMFDAHTHLSISTPGDERAQVARPVEERVLLALRHFEAMLAEGVTTIRVLGEPGFFDLRLRAALSGGLAPAPRMVVAGRIVAPSHAYLSLLDAPADGEQVAVRVRENLAQRVDWIKLYTTASSLLGDPREAYFSREEIALATATARRAGVPVAVHAHGGPAVDYCLDAGVTTVEHGRFLTDAQLERMASTGTALCSTVGIGVLADSARTGVDVDTALARSEQSVGRALEAGVTVIPGTDAVHGRLRLELTALEHHGATRQQALEAATSTAARVLGCEQMGRLEPGYLADFAVLAGDPTTGEELPAVVATCIAGRVAWAAATKPESALAQAT